MTDRPDSDSSYDFAPKAPEKPRRETELPRQTPRREPLTVEPAPAQAAPEVERICPHCGFRIVGKPRGGRCPECAAALDEVAIDLLQFADAAWLHRVANGALLLGTAVALQVVAIVLGWSRDPRLGNLSHVVASAIAIIGVWMLTAREPAASLGIVRTSIAALARLAAIAVTILWTAVLLLDRGESDGRAAVLNLFAVMITLATMGAFAIAVGLYVRSLAQRIPNDSLSNQSINLGFILAGTCVFLILLQAGGVANTGYLKWFFCAFPMIAGMAAVVAWAVFNLIRLALDLRNRAAAGQAIVARQALRAQARVVK